MTSQGGVLDPFHISVDSSRCNPLTLGQLGRIPNHVMIYVSKSAKMYYTDTQYSVFDLTLAKLRSTGDSGSEIYRCFVSSLTDV